MKLKASRRYGPQLQLFGCGMVALAMVAGCQTPVQEESFAKPFDAQRVVQLSHEAHRVAWDVTIWARHDLRFAAFRPTGLDYEAVYYLDEIRRRSAWIALKVEKNPSNPRASSKEAYDLVAYDAMMLRKRYEPSSFNPSTDAKIEHLLSMLDEIATYYVPNEKSPH